MFYQKGFLARPLDDVLAHGSRVAVLRVLHGAPDGLSGRRVARLGGINHQSAALALRDLARLGLVEKREFGRVSNWRLDRRKFLFAEMLESLFEGEARFATEFAARVKSRLARSADHVFVVGATAKGRLAAGHAVEMIVLCETGRRRALNEALRALEREMSEEFGLPLRVSVMGKRDAAVRMEILDAWQLLPTEGRPTTYLKGA